MGAYKTAIITTAGQSLIAQALAGNSAVKFTSLKTSNHSYAASTNFETLTSLQGIKQSAGITSAIVVNQTTVKISARVSNVGITTAYYINTIGVYAETDGITETLLAVIPASTADFVPAYSAGAPYSFIYDINLTIQNSSSLNVTINDSGVATVSDLEHFYEKVYDVYVSDTASGEVASFEDGANKIPMESVNVNMSPIQSFNGYDFPWAAGAGKNKLPYPYGDGASKTTNGITYTVDANGVVTANGTATADNVFYLVSSGPSALANKGLSSGTYVLNGSPSSSNSSNYYIQLQYNGTFTSSFASGTTFTYDASGGGNDMLRIYVKSGAILNNVEFKPMIRPASVSDATYAPYSNICPISGRAEVTINVGGSNLITSSNTEDGSINASGVEGNVFGFKRTKLIPVNGAIAINFTIDTGYTIRLHGYDSSGIWVKQINYYFNISANHDVVSIPNGISYIRLSFPAAATGVSIENVTIHTRALERTVYGGTLDIVSGALTITDANITNYAGEALPGEWLSSYDKYAEGATPTTGAQVVYKLATPQTAQIEPLQIDSLYGYNNVWSDVGNVDVKYRADTTLYINKKIAEMQALILENS